jgi:site-specific DNA recombinase
MAAMWNKTTILGHPQRMNGILRNELYNGRLIYNRVRMVKDPATGKRISRPNPPRRLAHRRGAAAAHRRG